MPDRIGRRCVENPIWVASFTTLNSSTELTKGIIRSDFVKESGDKSNICVILWGGGGCDSDWPLDVSKQRWNVWKLKIENLGWWNMNCYAIMAPPELWSTAINAVTQNNFQMTALTFSSPHRVISIDIISLFVINLPWHGWIILTSVSCASQNILESQS
jgi:hypothetical protein